MSSDVVTVELGGDSFQAHLIAESCRADGLAVELLTTDESSRAVGMAPIVPHRLLVRPEELAAVQRIVSAFGYGEEA